MIAWAIFLVMVGNLAMAPIIWPIALVIDFWRRDSTQPLPSR